MPEETVSISAYSAAYAAPWFVSRRPYCEGRNGSLCTAPNAGGAVVAGKTFRSALRVFNVAQSTAPPCLPPSAVCNGGATYGCCEYRYADNEWTASRWRRAYAPASAMPRTAQPHSKCDDGRRGDSKSSADGGGGAIEHGGRTNTENFLPRIIKPRKRKKKDRKPSGADAPSSSASSMSSGLSQLPKKVDEEPALYPKSGAHVSRSLLEGLRSAAAVAAAAALAADQYTIEGRLAMLKSLRTFDGDLAVSSGADDAVALFAAMVDADTNDEQTETVFCNCRYCDPQGVVWDVKEKRYSANLMQPGVLSVGAYCAAPAPASEERLPAPKSSVVDTRRPQKLQVSSQIVTSLNGHRDIEIKFYSSSSEKS